MTKIEPNWDLYRSFLRVIKTGSLSGAAKSLGLTQPTLGRHIDALEDSMGISLFTRSQNGFTPTEAALRLQPYAESLEATTSALLREVSGHEKIIQGSVRISASEIISTEVLPKILTRLRQKHSRLNIELVSSNQAQNLLGREADIAVRMFQPKQQALIAKRIGETELGWYAHKDYLALHGTPNSVKDLADHSLIGFDQETAFIRDFKKRLSSLERENFSFRSDSDLAQLAAIRSGYGIGICQARLAQKDKNLIQVLPKIFHAKLGVWVTMHENLKANPRCRVTFDALAEGLSDYLGR